MEFVKQGSNKALLVLENLRFGIPLGNPPMSWLLLAAPTTLYYLCYCILSQYRKSRIPLVGKRYELRAITGWRFFRDAASVLHDGYSGRGFLQFKNRRANVIWKYPSNVWRFIRADTEMIALPSKYVNELRSLPHYIASPTLAHAYNLSGSSTNMNIILKSDLHIRAIQEGLTPNLNKLTIPIMDELDHAIQTELPGCERKFGVVVQA